MNVVGHPKRLGWYQVPFDQSEVLWGVPGVYFEGGQIVAHQSHLPLLDPSAVGHLLAKNTKGSTIWDRRDVWAAECGFKLRATQQQAVDFASDRRGILLCDEQRLGKTLSALMADVEWRRAFDGLVVKPRARPQYGPLVIIAPLSTRAVWLGWAKRCYPNVEIGVIHGRTFDKAILKKPIVFGHYDVIHKWQAIMEIGTLILDEVQGLTNSDSRRSKAAKTLSAYARHVVACTGTPISKYPPDLWGLLDIIAPGAWGSKYDFNQRYGDPRPTAHGTRYEGISNENELRARLSEVMLRRLWRDCHMDLPPITRSIVVADLSQAERNKLDILAGQIKSERANTVASLAAYRKQTSAIKVKTVIAEIEKVLDRGEPVVCWTWHKDFADRLLKKLMERERGVVKIHGDIQVTEREKCLAQWRAMPPACLIATMAVAGAGIDLSHARIGLFAEIDWTPQIIGQAEMRTYNPTRPMDLIFIVANHLVDQRIVRSLVAKLSAQDPLGVAAAIDSIDALRDAVLGPQEDGDLDRLLADLLASG